MSPNRLTQYLIDVTVNKPKGKERLGYPFNLPTVRKTNFIEFDPKVTFFVGENGSGKSTLIEAIAVAMGFNAEGGSKNFNFSTQDSHSDLHSYLDCSKSFRPMKDGYFLRAESFYNVASQIHKYDEEPLGGPPVIDSYGGKSLHEQSHGESFMALVEHRFHGKGLYILDEPEAALSPARQLKLIRLMRDLIEKGAQFIIATHSPILMSYPEAKILLINENGLTQTPYEQTPHYETTKYFLNNYKRMLSEVLG
jgi:predicted ATPase